MSKTDFNYDISYTHNRELSWLKFNERVLQESEDSSVPLLERLKFVSIFASNLDEFFMIRIGSLYDLSHLKKETFDNKSRMTPEEQLEQAFEAIKPLYAQKDAAFFTIEKCLREHQIYNLAMEELTSQEVKFVDQFFKNEVLPLLSPQIIDFHHPFPHLWNKALYAIAQLNYKDQVSTVGILQIPTSLPKVLFMPGNSLRYILMEKVILHYYESVFDFYTVTNKCIISVTRNADISPKDEAFDFDEDFRTHMKQIIKKRSRLAPVRLEVEGALSKVLSKYLMMHLRITEKQIFLSKSPLTLSYAFGLGEKVSASAKRCLTYQPFKPAWSQGVNQKESIISQVKQKDILLSYPYEDIKPFLNLLKESATNPSVKSIKITLYRLASQSKIIDYICQAAENGKDVTVLIELRARFDEKNNIEWAERLEEAGCKMIYGFEDFKVHSKICLITLMGKEEISYITQIGTGNYNEKTAKLYTDFCLITADEDIGKDAMNFFKNMAISNLEGEYTTLMVAPHAFKLPMLRLIDEEIEKCKNGKEGRLIFKANSLTERDLIDKLKEASQAGVKIDLIIRGICCLLPGIKGKTENINVISIVGRFLEHPRVYCFGEGEDAKIYISSGDLMTRNMTRRVEISCPILDSENKKRILHMLDKMLKDNVKARSLQGDGIYIKKQMLDGKRLDSQQYFIKEAEINENKLPLSKWQWIKNKCKKLITNRIGN
jgi:polyphosphate kinase